MTATAALREGAGAVAGSKRLIAMFWIFLLVGGLLASGPVSGLIGSVLAHSEYGGQLGKHFDPSWLLEIFSASRGFPVGMETSALVVVAIMAILTQIFFAGGAIAVFMTSDRRYTAARFFGGCGRYFWRFFRLFLLGLVCYGLVLAVSTMLMRLGEKIWGEGMVETPLFYFSRLRYATVILLFGFVNTALDYAKIRLVAAPGRSAVKAMWWGFGFVTTHLSQTMGIWLAVTVGGLAWLAGLLPLLRGWSGAALISILAGIAAQQVYVCGRVALRLWAWAAGSVFYQGVRPATAGTDGMEPVFVWPPRPVMTVVAGIPPEEEAAGPA